MLSFMFILIFGKRSFVFLFSLNSNLRNIAIVASIWFGFAMPSSIIYLARDLLLMSPFW